MRRIKLNRPPPVSSESVKDVSSDNTAVNSLSKTHQHVLTEGQTRAVSALDISTDVDRRLITSRDTVTVEEDTRKVVKHKRTVVQDVRKEPSTAASENASQSLSTLLVASDSSVKETEEKQQHGNVVTHTDTVQISLPGTQCNYAEQAIVASTDNTVITDCQDTASVTHRGSSSKKPSKTVVGKTWSDSAASVPSGSASAKGSGDNSCMTHPSQETVVHVERQQSGLEGDRKLSGLLLDDVLKGFLVKKLAVIESERKTTDVNIKDDSMEAVVQNEPKDFTPSSTLRRRKRSREKDEQRRDLDLRAKLRDRDNTLYHCDEELTKAHTTHCDAGYRESHLDNWPHEYIHHEHHHLPTCLGVEVDSFRRGHGKHKHSERHSLHTKRHLLSSLKEDRRTEYQSYNLPQPEKNQCNEQKSFDYIEQIRQFVSHAAQKSSQPVSQDHAPLESYYENSCTTTHGRERQKSGSTSHHHHHHHHHLKKQKNVQEGMLTTKKPRKHKHKHHHNKNMLPDAHVECKKSDKSEIVHHIETKDEDDTFSKSRSLSPLGLPRKHRKKHKKKKSIENTVSQIHEHNVSLLPEKSDTRYENISSDEEFIPMKVQKNDEDDAGDTAALNVLHKVDMPKAVGVKQDPTSSKSAGLKSKFLKMSGKRPKRQTRVSDVNQSAEVPMSSDQSNVSVEEHPGQTALEDHSQVVKDTAADLATTEDTPTPVVAAGQDDTGQTGNSHKVLAPLSFIASEHLSGSDADDRGDLHTLTVNAGQVGEGNTISTDEASMASQRCTVSAVDSDNLTAKSFRSDEMLKSGENEQQETMEETDGVAKELLTEEDSDCASKSVSSDNTSSTVKREELKSSSEEHATDYAVKSECSRSEKPEEFRPDIEPDETCEKTPTKEQDWNTEKMKSKELEAVVDEGENITHQHSVSDDSVTPAVACLLQPNQTADTEAPATRDITSREGVSVMKTMSTAESIPSNDGDENVSENNTAVPVNSMGPPLALPPSAAFKKPLPMMKMSLRITDTSADFISSGATKNEKDKKAGNAENREEGKRAVSVVDCLIFLSATESILTRSDSDYIAVHYELIDC